METFIRFLYEFLSQIFLGFTSILKGITTGIGQIFDIKTYQNMIGKYQSDLSMPEWILVVIAILFVVIFIGLIIALQILKDVLKLNFKKRYVLEFAETLLKKPKKIKSILNIIDNAAIQDKISLKIRYEQFLNNQETVYELMREGYKITAILDNSFDATFKNIESLQMFEFVIINRNLKQYEEIINNKGDLHNIIEIWGRIWKHS